MSRVSLMTEFCFLKAAELAIVLTFLLFLPLIQMPLTNFVSPGCCSKVANSILIHYPITSEMSAGSVGHLTCKNISRLDNCIKSFKDKHNSKCLCDGTISVQCTISYVIQRQVCFLQILFNKPPNIINVSLSAMY